MPNPSYTDVTRGAGIGSGSSIDPWGSWAECFADSVGPGQVSYIVGSEAPLYIPTLSSSGAEQNKQQFIACDNSTDWNYLRGGATVNAANVNNAINTNAYDYSILKGIKFINAQLDGTAVDSGTVGNDIIECDFDGHGGTYGAILYGSYNRWLGCRFRNNAGMGLYYGNGVITIDDSLFTGNGSYGCNGNSGSLNIRNSVFANNSNHDIYNISINSNIQSCSFYKGGGNAINMGGRHSIKDCIFEDYDVLPALHNTSASNVTNLIRCSFFSNGAGDMNASARFCQMTPNIALTVSPFLDAPAGDFNMSSGNPETVNLEVEYDDTNSSFINLGGLQPEIPSASTPIFGGVTGVQPNSKGEIHLAWAAGSNLTWYVIYITTDTIDYSSDEVWGARPFGVNNCVITTEADGTPLINNQNYNIAVRAYKVGSSAFENNVVTKNIAPKGTDGTFIIKQVAGT